MYSPPLQTVDTADSSQTWGLGKAGQQSWFQLQSEVQNTDMMPSKELLYLPMHFHIHLISDVSKYVSAMRQQHLAEVQSINIDNKQHRWCSKT